MGCTTVVDPEQGRGAEPGAADGSSVNGVTVVTRVARLTNAQYDSTVAALLGTTDKVASSFAPDASEGYAFDNSINLRVDGRLGPQYRAAAEELAERAAADPGFAAKFVPCAEGSAGCSDSLIAELGKRAFRRPLTDAERARFATLFARGAELVGSGDAFRDGVRLVVEALLHKTILDNSAILYANELSDGKAHSYIDLPFIIAGSAGGHFQQGQYVRLAQPGDSKSAPHNRLLTTLVNALGVSLDRFGTLDEAAQTMQSGQYEALLA